MMFLLNRAIAGIVLLLITVILPVRGQEALPVWGETIRDLLAGPAPGQVSRYFSPMVELRIPGYQGYYSDVQATRILKSFFDLHQVTAALVKENGKQDNGSEYLLGQVEAGRKVFRLYLASRTKGTARSIHLFQLQEIRPGG